MARYFQKELDRIKKMILSLGAMVEDRLRMAIEAIEDKDAEIAQRIIKDDYQVDEMEVDIEEECLKVLALHQPVAVDLRFIVAVIKINNDLERIGDEAVNIARRIITLNRHASQAFYLDYGAMADQVQSMVKMSLDALVTMDVDLGFKVVTMDDKVDSQHREAYDLVKGAMESQQAPMGYLLNFYMVSRHLERIGDHATNIAEEVIYMIEGEIVRHGNY